MSDIQIDARSTGAFDFLVDGTGDNVPRRKRATGIDFFREILSLRIDENPTLATDCLANEERTRLGPSRTGIVETGRVKLDELHVSYRRPSPPAECDGITGRGVGIGRVEIDLPTATCGQNDSV